MDEVKQRFSALLAESFSDRRDEDTFDVIVGHLRSKKIRDEAANLSIKKRKPKATRRSACGGWKLKAALIVLLSVAISAVISPSTAWQHLVEYVSQTECLVETNFFVMEMSRPVFDCDICRNLTEVPVVTNISRQQFVDQFAYTDVPVLVKNATANWTAMDTFSFQYFRRLYEEAAKRHRGHLTGYTVLDSRQEDVNSRPDHEGDGLACQFFPYKTEFVSLLDAFNMSEDRAAFKDGEKPWYIGWSNCDEDIQSELRSHYQRPYFLPVDSETSSIDWIFMGGKGRGAPMHIDNVNRPSWQAQISGSKTWHLEPPPECLSECHKMSVKVEQGDIFVINTNVWYHSTFVHPGPVSICIGSEYD